MDWQCRMVGGVQYGFVYVPADAHRIGLQLAASWPDSVGHSSTASGYADKAFENRRSLLHKAADDIDPAGEVRDFIAFPVTAADRSLGVVVLVTEIRAEAQRQAVLRLVEWGAVWLEKTLIGLHTDRRGDARTTLQAVGLLATPAPIPVVAHQLCNLIAERFSCTRVALGLASGMQVQLTALSEQVSFDRRLDLVTRIQAAMEECIDQDEAVCEPHRNGTGHGLRRAHKRLCESGDGAAVCSVPVATEQRVIGALTLLWDDADHVDETVISRLVDLMTQLAPVLELKQRDARSAWRRMATGVRGLTQRLFGAGHFKLKMMVVGALALLLTLSLVQTERRVGADASLEGTTQQAIVAPVDGYLLTAAARAGDRVEKDQLLATIDDRELRLEQQKLQSELDKHAKEYQEALGARDRAKVTIAQARMTQAEVQLKLNAEQIERTRLLAPFSGTLISGDLSRAIGAPFERGQLLFEIVPSGSYRVALQVDERDIAELAVGQRGKLRLASLPDQDLAFEVSRIVPLATADAGGNRFRVEAELLSPPHRLRPGMHGVAKVTTGEASLLSAWTRELIARVRFWLWTVGY